MTNVERERLVEELTRLLSARLLWVLLPARRALSIQNEEAVGNLVSWAANSVSSDISTILERYEISTSRGQR